MAKLISYSRAFIKEHYLALMLAFLVGFISVAPQFIFSFSSEYKGIQMFGTDTEDYYVARVNEVYDGHFRLGNVFLPDKNKPYMVPPLGEIIMAGLGKALFLDAAGVTVFAKFLFPFALFMVLYSFVYSVFLSRSIAIVSGLFILLGDNLLSNSADIIGLFTFFTTSKDFLSYTRPINPQISSLLLFLSLFFLWKAGVDERGLGKRRAVLLGVLSGLSIFVSIYVWSFLIIALFFSFVYVWWRERKFSIAFFAAIIVHIATTVPFWLNSLEARMYPEYADTAARLGLAASRAPIWGVWLVFITGVVFFLWPKQYDRARWFFGILVFSSWVVINQQIITGIILQPGHYHWYIVKPISSILLAVVFVFFAEKLVKKPFLFGSVIFLAVVTFIYNAGLIQFSSYRAHLPRTLEKQRYTALFSYLQKGYQTPQTIWSDTRTSGLLPIYTIHNTLNNSVFVFLNSREFITRRVFFEYRLRGVTPEGFWNALEREKEYIASSIFGMIYYFYTDRGGAIAEMPPDVSAELGRRYEEFYRIPYRAVFQYFDIDLVIADKRYGRPDIYGSFPELEEVKEFDDKFIVYKINKDFAR